MSQGTLRSELRRDSTPTVIGVLVGHFHHGRLPEPKATATKPLMNILRVVLRPRKGRRSQPCAPVTRSASSDRAGAPPDRPVLSKKAKRLLSPAVPARA